MAQPAGAVKWVLASFLFGNRISQAIAAQTWRVIVEVHRRDTPHKLCDCHAQLVRMPGEGGYRRYDESTATRLSLVCRTLADEYGGRITGIADAAESRADFERRQSHTGCRCPTVCAIKRYDPCLSVEG